MQPRTFHQDCFASKMKVPKRSTVHALHQDHLRLKHGEEGAWRGDACLGVVVVMCKGVLCYLTQTKGLYSTHVLVCCAAV